MGCIVTLLLGVVVVIVMATTGLPMPVAIVVTLGAIFLIGRFVIFPLSSKAMTKEERAWTSPKDGAPFTGRYSDQTDQHVTVLIGGKKARFSQTDEGVSEWGPGTLCIKIPKAALSEVEGSRHLAEGVLSFGQHAQKMRPRLPFGTVCLAMCTLCEVCTWHSQSHLVLPDCPG
jgi:hypothetical protein